MFVLRQSVIGRPPFWNAVCRHKEESRELLLLTTFLGWGKTDIPIVSQHKT